MGKLVKRRGFINPYFVQGFEAWLKDMAAKGLVFDHKEHGICYFQKTEPIDMDYRVVIRKECLEEVLESKLEEAGYQCIYREDEVRIFACKRKDLMYRVNRDLENENRALDTFRKKNVKYTFRALGIALILFAYAYLISGNITPIATRIFIKNEKLSIGFCLFAVVASIVYVIQLFYIKMYRKRVCKITLPRNERLWNGCKVMQHMEAAFSYTILAIPFMLIVLGLVVSGFREREKSFSMVALSNVQGIEQSMVSENYIFRDTSDLTKQHVVGNQVLLDSDENGKDVSLYSEYYVLRTSFLVKRLAKERITMTVWESIEEELINGTLQELEEEGLDYAAYLPSSDSSVFAVAAVKNQELMYAIYEGDKTYKDVLKEMKNTLLQTS